MKNVTGKKISEKADFVKGMTVQFTEENLIFKKFISVDFTRRLHTYQKILNIHPTILQTPTPNCWKQACGNRFSGEDFSEDLFFPGFIQNSISLAKVT